MFGKTQHWVQDRLRRWLWRKHNRTKALWSDYPNELLHDRYGLWQLPMRVSWKLIRQTIRMPRDEATRKAGYGKSVRPV